VERGQRPAHAAHHQTLGRLPAVEGIGIVRQQHAQRFIVQAVLQHHGRAEAAQQRGHGFGVQPRQAREGPALFGSLQHQQLLF
jgi:hypothetical protein